MSNEVQSYLDYLDKEMTIMGVLSAFSFSVATVAAGVAIKNLPEPLGEIWTRGHPYVMAGCLFAGFAACVFYFERSLLAWYYGQIALSRFRGAASPQSIEDNVTWADGWDTWFWYGTGLVALVLSLFSYACASLMVFDDAWIPGLAKWSVLVLTSAAIVHGWIRWYVFRRYPQAQRPFQKMWAAIRDKGR